MIGMDDGFTFEVRLCAHPVISRFATYFSPNPVGVFTRASLRSYCLSKLRTKNWYQFCALVVKNSTVSMVTV